MTSVSFSICSLIYIIIFNVVYFGKKRINLEENKVYSTLLITTTLGLIIDIIGYISFKKLEMDSIFNITISKLYLIYYFTWAFEITVYTNIISFKKSIKRLMNKIWIFYIAICLIIFILPIKFQTTEYALYSYGPSVNFVYLLSGICIIIMLTCLTVKRKSIKQRKYIPLLALIVAASLVVLIQKINPELLLLTFAESIVTGLMYFTIENPDLQMVEELSKNKKLTEQNYEEKTNFVFKISQELKKPLEDITNLSNKIYENSEGNIKEQAQIINTNSKQLYTYVNKALDISTMDIKNLKIVESTYNTKNFFEEIKLRTKSELKKQNKNIELRYNISNSIPEYLIGDNTKLKQVIISVILDSIKHTEEGFIELDVNSIVRYGVCRLMIDISDSGKGMELEKINSILSVSETITKEEAEKIDKLNITLPFAHKIIKSLNGSFIIKSEINNGTNFLIVIDQKIDTKEKIKHTSLEHYSTKITNQKKIMVVCNNPDIIKIIKDNLEDVDVTSALFAKDCMNKLKQEKNYECIIIDEDLNEESGNNLLEQIKKQNINTPSIILLSKNNQFLEKHYSKDGFDNTLIKENIKDEIEIIKKYL